MYLKESNKEYVRGLERNKEEGVTKLYYNIKKKRKIERVP